MRVSLSLVRSGLGQSSPCAWRTVAGNSGILDIDARSSGRPDLLTSSDAVDRALPARRLNSSADLGWRSLVARTYEDRPLADEFSTTPTPALLVVLVTNGNYAIESHADARWRRADYHPGAVGVSAPGTSATLRWRALSGDRMTSLHMYLCPELIEQTSRDLGGPNRLPDTLLLDDPLIATMGGAVNQALQRRAPALYADSVAQALAVHLLHTNQITRISEESALGRSTLGTVIGYMREHLAEDVTLDDLAAQVNLSKFHLLRMFKKSTGSTPHAYLVRMRLGRAANLLQHSQLPVSQIAVECGYQSPGQFSATFRRAYGVSPRDYRTMVG